MRSGSSSVGGRRWPASIASVSAGVEDAQELLDLAVLRLPAGLDPALPVGQPERGRRRGRPPGAAAPSRGRAAVGGHGRRPRPPVHDRLALLGDAQLVGLGHGVDVPVAERLCQQRGERTRRGVAHRVVGRVGLRLVVGRHLERPAVEEVDVAQLDAPPPRRSPRRRPDGDGAHERLGVEDRRGTRASAASRGSLIATPPRRRRPAGPRPARPGSPAGDDEDSPLDPTDRQRPLVAVRESTEAHRQWPCSTAPAPRDRHRQRVQDQVENGQAPDSMSASGTHATASVVPSTSTTRGSASPTTRRGEDQVHPVEVLEPAGRRDAR